MEVFLYYSNICGFIGCQFSVAVTRTSWSMQLLYARPG